MKAVFYFVIGLITLEVIVLGISGFEQSFIAQFLVYTYYILTLIIFIVLALVKSVVLLVIADEAALQAIFSDILQALLLILLIIFIRSIELVLRLLLSPLRIFGEGLVDTAVDAVMKVFPDEWSFDITSELDRLFVDNFGVSIIIPYTLQIFSSGGVLSFSAFKRKDSSTGGSSGGSSDPEPVRQPVREFTFP